MLLWLIYASQLSLCSLLLNLHRPPYWEPVLEAVGCKLTRPGMGEFVARALIKSWHLVKDHHFESYMRPIQEMQLEKERQKEYFIASIKQDKDQWTRGEAQNSSLPHSSLSSPRTSCRPPQTCNLPTQNAAIPKHMRLRFACVCVLKRCDLESSVLGLVFTIHSGLSGLHTQMQHG